MKKGYIFLTWVLSILQVTVMGYEYRDLPFPNEIIQSFGDIGDEYIEGYTIPHPKELLRSYGVEDEYIEGCVIPKVLYKTGPTKTCRHSAPLQELFAKNAAITGYKILFFDDSESREVFVRYLSKRHLQAYDLLKPKTFKADLFRLAILYLCGGVYADLLQEFLVDPQPYIQHNQFACSFVRILSDKHGINGAILNAMMVAPPRHPLFKYILDQITEDIHRRLIPEFTSDWCCPVMGVTGPPACTKYYGQFFSSSEHLELPPTGTKSCLQGLDGKYYIIQSPFELIVTDSIEYICDAFEKKIVKRNKYPTNALYNHLFRHRRHYSKFSVDDIYYRNVSK